MTEPLVIGEKVLGLLDETSMTATYKPALLLAILDESLVAAATGADPISIPVRSLARRVAEMYWPQTLPYAFAGVLSQNQGGQAEIVSVLVRLRTATGSSSRNLGTVRDTAEWEDALNRIEHTLAQWPIPRLQNPYGPFLYDFDWPFAESWGKRKYAATSRALALRPGVGRALASLGPLLRPFIQRRWTDKAAQLNQAVITDAKALLDFEAFLFGPERIALGRVRADLMQLQAGSCFYCARRLRGTAHVDHFVPWSHCGDDGVDNLVAACSSCNSAKSSILPASDHLSSLLERNRSRDEDLERVSMSKNWPRDRPRTDGILRAAYLLGPAERPVWRFDRGAGRSGYAPLENVRAHARTLLAA